MRKARQVVFLMYHELEMSGRPLCQSEAGYRRYVLTVDEFRSQMHWLQDGGWQGLSVGAWLASLAGNEDAQNRVVVTFDDGCETDLLVAAPILQEAGFVATFYVTAGFLGRLGYMDAAQVRELSTQGFEIGCHSMTHSYLNDLDKDGKHCEIVDAKTKLEDILGKPVEHFSCPGGRWNVGTLQVAREAGYQSVTNSHAQINTAATDLFALGRVAVQREAGLAAFQQICLGQNLWRMQLQEQLRNTAKQVLGNRIYDRGRELLLRK
jgi:peptidoglycan/xylan/chitin deacetylase (PgdA/CDA1 family)